MRRKTARKPALRIGPPLSAMGLAHAYAAAQNAKLKALQEKNEPPRMKLKLRKRKISGPSEGQ